jgi:chromosome segregation ATPase
MSDFGTSKQSILPEDIEARLARVQENISILDGQIIKANTELESKKLELSSINSSIASAVEDYKNKVSAGEVLTKNLDEREAKLSQRESALNVYANALEEKEKQINKYLVIFENAGKIISK